MLIWSSYFFICSLKDFLEILSGLFKIFSKLPNSLIKARAVFSPMPGTPGILSEASPFKAKISTIFSGPTPNFFFIPSSS